MRSRARRLRKHRRLARSAYHSLVCEVIRDLRDRVTFMPSNEIQKQWIEDECLRCIAVGRPYSVTVDPEKNRDIIRTKVLVTTIKVW